jgi:hypothetical protein
MPSRASSQTVYATGRCDTTYYGGSKANEYVQNTSKNWTDSVTFGDNIPEWRRYLREGVNATTSMLGTKNHLRITPGIYRVRRTSFYPPIEISEATGYLRLAIDLPVGDPASVSVSKADNLALSKFAQKLSLVNTSIQGGVVLGELRQTLQLIRNPAQGLRRLVDDWGVTARRIRGANVYPLAFRKKKVMENLADAWLEAQFGWRPLLSDIKSGCEALQKYNTGQSLSTRRISAYHKESGGDPDTKSVQGAGIAFWYAHLRKTSHCEVIYRGAVRVEAQDPQQMSAELLGVNPGSFLPTAWELIPYSFLIDYFSNIGGIIYGWSNLFTELAWCNRTTRQSLQTEQWTSTPDEYFTVTQPGNQTYSVFHSPAKVVGTTTRVSRAKYTGTMVPGLAFKIPSFGSLKWLNIAALVASRKADRNWTFD